MLNKAAYAELCRHDASVGLFAQDWWLDAACGAGGWDVAVVVGGDVRVDAALPFSVRRRAGFGILSQPPFTPRLGPWIRDGQDHSRHGTEFHLMAELADALPRFDRYAQNWSYEVTNWLPFFWKGFQQTTRYSYVLPDLSSEEAIWAGMRSNIRREIRKASGRYGLRLRDDLELDVLLKLNELTYERRGMTPPDGATLRRIDDACRDRDCRRLIVAEDERGRRHAAGYFVWDAESAYYLVGGMDPMLRTSGAMSLVMWSGIRLACRVTKRFDFEGSMVESIARFFRAFGGEQIGYSYVTKTPSRLLRTVLTARGRYP